MSAVHEGGRDSHRSARHDGAVIGGKWSRGLPRTEPEGDGVRVRSRYSS